MPRSGREDTKRQVTRRSHAAVVASISDAIVIKDGEPFFLCPPDGQIPMDGDHGFGLYHHDTRFLGGYELRIVGIRPDPLAATAAAGTTAIIELTNPALKLDDGRRIDKDALAIRWTRALDGARTELVDTLDIRNHDSDAVELAIRVDLAADFRDIFEIRGLLDAPRGTLEPATWQDDILRFAYDGKDLVRRTLSVTFEPGPHDHDDHGADVQLTVPGRGAATMTIRLRVGETIQSGGRPIERLARPQSADAGRSHGASKDVGTNASQDDGWLATVRTSSPLLDAVVSRSFHDLGLLRGELDGLHYYSAGIPWFSTLFGRDSLIAAYQTLAYDPRVAGDTLRLLAKRQGTRDDAWRDEQPGKIMHELRIGELARLGIVPQTPYYGSVDSTPLFLMLLAEHAAWTGSLDLFHALDDNVDHALGWIDQASRGELDGYLAYSSTSDGGLANQGWKDSGNAIVDAEGRIARPPIALAEVQGYVYAARLGLADLYQRDGRPERAAEQRSAAEALRRRFERDFWSDAMGSYVLALQKDGEPCAVDASNAGQVLLSGISSRDHARAVAGRMLQEDLFGGWGIRTMSTEAVAYNPVGYHLGTVWPHDNSLIAAGFRRYGLDEQAGRILEAMVAAAEDFEHHRLPECFAGLDRKVFGIPVRYPVACHPQAWAAGSVPYLLVGSLGLEPHGFEHRLRVVRPRLPQYVEHLEIAGLPVGDARVDLSFHRADDRTTVTVGRVDGRLDVEVVEAGETIEAGDPGDVEPRADAGAAGDG